jgi:hypothetical protein
MADEHNLAPAPIVNLCLAMHFGHERTSRVDCKQIAPCRFLGNRTRHPVRRENDWRVVIGHFTQVLDENRPLGAQAVDDVTIVHNLMAHVDRRPIYRECPLD